MTLTSKPVSIPPYLPTQHDYKPTHPSLFKVNFAGEHDEFSSSLSTVRAFTKGETICAIENTLPGTKAYSSVQVLPDPPIPGQDLDALRHIELNSDLLFVNHSCEPNVAFNINKSGDWKVVALKDLKQGEIMTFAYFSTEWDMDQPFHCLCGASQCLGIITGAKEIAPEILSRFFINDHILAMKKQQTSPTSSLKASNAMTAESAPTYEVQA
ncbi:BZ3500_MvSof-1268-A1-R1_Chr2-3g05264 [Microbotryum saponariae]|uniref:BZ3500_MvSof-1268-A1-R1_Chr2-3g05264 protein n=1 Tax=Microbotryum saponariae TaxID=289078 RepID=A0A2X0L7W0_9BASI|nr:BZ3500_MvSof-1268-A1-R1_Chr2-3g05264 [Microbotryum saponariae]SDA01090.1 BZ3501_MvSof-1269-A2-R1_Chr2-2g04937 [Microbotryum saponariae]